MRLVRSASLLVKNHLPETSAELIQAAIKGAVSSIPVVGGLVAELGSCLASPLEKRKRAWCEEIEHALQELAEKHSCLPQALAEDPQFVSALLRATAAALATHSAIKLRMLRAFTVAVGSRAIPEDELQAAIVHLVEDLSIGHIEVLRFLDQNATDLSQTQSMEGIYERYKSGSGTLDRMAFRWILSNLESHMVIHLGDIADMDEYASLQITITTSETQTRPLQITQLGKRFLALMQGC